MEKAHAGPKLSSNDTFLDTRAIPEDFRIPNPSLKVFTFADLERATRNFHLDLLLGEGAFGKVFLGWVNHKTFAPSKRGVGLAVAVKRLKEGSFHGLAEWQAKVAVLGRVAHPNIISLLGYCNDKENEYLLVYEYMQNRSFDHFLYTKTSNIVEPLPWETRLSIMIGVARGLAYLHSLKDQVILRHKVFLANGRLDVKAISKRCSSSGKRLGDSGWYPLVSGSNHGSSTSAIPRLWAGLRVDSGPGNRHASLWACGLSHRSGLVVPGRVQSMWSLK
ncbi:hypothetical protein OSB04_014840 [Centaurea solstitialis]|uniref:Protein kinase domain-containing protein n=1 Tax=Centaurea solstitialis TaxID=347529 RepID=A0AA38T9T2_9ASTR|nr:hypothetical protein OSB04_014840 [Centaurea solstitialis]